jgi:5-hydroxyisourate hydrolase
MSQLTTHVLDTSKGKPAEGIAVYLFREQQAEWIELTLASTNADGRIPDLIKPGIALEPGNYKLRFSTAEYFQSQGQSCFYPYVEIVFSITGNEHYHVPLLLSAFGYSTYRGS